MKCTLHHHSAYFTARVCNCTEVTVSYVIKMYLAAFASECTKVHAVGDVVADGAHVLAFV